MKNEVIILFKNSSFKYCSEERMKEIIRKKASRISFILIPVLTEDVQGGWIPVYPNAFMSNFVSAHLTYQICVRYREEKVNYMRNYQLQEVSLEIHSIVDLYNQLHSITLIEHFNTEINIKEYQLGREYNYDFYKFSLDCYGEEDLLASIRVGLDQDELQNDLVGLVIYKIYGLINGVILDMYKFDNPPENDIVRRRVISMNTNEMEWEYLEDVDIFMIEDKPLEYGTVGVFCQLTELIYFVAEKAYSSLSKIDHLTVLFLQKYVAYPDRESFDPAPDNRGSYLLSESSISLVLLDCILETIMCGNYFYHLMYALINNPMTEKLEGRDLLERSHIAIAISYQFILKDGSQVSRIFTESHPVSLQEIIIAIDSIDEVNENIGMLCSKFHGEYKERTSIDNSTLKIRNAVNKIKKDHSNKRKE